THPGAVWQAEVNGMLAATSAEFSDSASSDTAAAAPPNSPPAALSSQVPLPSPLAILSSPRVHKALHELLRKMDSLSMNLMTILFQLRCVIREWLSDHHGGTIWTLDTALTLLDRMLGDLGKCHKILPPLVECLVACSPVQMPSE